MLKCYFPRRKEIAGYLKPVYLNGSDHPSTVYPREALEK